MHLYYIDSSHHSWLHVACIECNSVATVILDNFATRHVNVIFRSKNKNNNKSGITLVK